MSQPARLDANLIDTVQPVEPSELSIIQLALDVRQNTFLLSYFRQIANKIPHETAITNIRTAAIEVKGKICAEYRGSPIPKYDPISPINIPLTDEQIAVIDKLIPVSRQFGKVSQLPLLLGIPEKGVFENIKEIGDVPNNNSFIIDLLVSRYQLEEIKKAASELTAKGQSFSQIKIHHAHQPTETFRAGRLISPES